MPPQGARAGMKGRMLADRVKAHEQVVTQCGCVNHLGGEITYCPLHAEAPAMRELLRELIGRIERDERIEMRHLKGARALLARVDGAA